MYFLAFLSELRWGQELLKPFVLQMALEVSLGSRVLAPLDYLDNLAQRG